MRTGFSGSWNRCASQRLEASAIRTARASIPVSDVCAQARPMSDLLLGSTHFRQTVNVLCRISARRFRCWVDGGRRATGGARIQTVRQKLFRMCVPSRRNRRPRAGKKTRRAPCFCRFREFPNPREKDLVLVDFPRAVTTQSALHLPA